MTVLFFGIHPDDIELGCGGTVAQCVRSGHRVVLADLSDGSASSNGTPAVRARESADASRILGVAERVNLGLPDAAIQSENPDQLRVVVETIRRFRPELVVVPSSDDPHPDHAAGGRLVEHALYLSGIHGYVAGSEAWKVRKGLVYPGRNELDADVIVDVSEVYDIKRVAIAAHESQFASDGERKPTRLNAPDFIASIEGRDRVYGQKIGVRYGEPFRLLYPIGVVDVAAIFS